MLACGARRGKNYHEEGCAAVDSQPCECDQVQALRSQLVTLRKELGAAQARCNRLEARLESASDREVELYHNHTELAAIHQSCLDKMPADMDHGGCLETAVDLLLARAPVPDTPHLDLDSETGDWQPESGPEALDPDSETVYAYRLRAGMSINGRRIESVEERTAFGFVLVDWGFGSADSSELVRNVTIPPGLTLVDTKAHRPDEIRACRDCSCCYTPTGAHLMAIDCCSADPDVKLSIAHLDKRHENCPMAGKTQRWPE
jgi:hypothetical protein